MSNKYISHNGTLTLAVNGQPKPRRELIDAFAKAQKETERSKRHIRGSYDAAQDLQDTTHHWASADANDADSANSRAVREKLVQRSRYECANNGYADGIANSYANDAVGNGPQLRMQTGSEGFNRMVELRWFEWMEAVQFGSKLWTAARAKHVDGEGLGVLRRNEGVNNQVKLDWVLYETEQCQTPLLGMEPGKIDGIRFDAFGNPISYDFLKQHPGGGFSWLNAGFETEPVDARFVTHWFKRLRPGQHRGIPETTSTLNLGAAARRWRESTLAHAEMIAKLTVLLKSLMPPAEEDADPVTALSTLELLTGTLMALPNTVEPVQLDAKQPAAQYEMFHKTLINEQSRPKCMPYIKAACDASGANYATGRLDHQGYYGCLDIDRRDADRAVLDVAFNVWFDLAIVAYGWLGGNPAAITQGARAHLWDWPKHKVVDIQAEAEANDTKLKNGSEYLYSIATQDGRDYEDEILKAAAANGITQEQQRQVNLLLNVPPRSLPFVAEVLGIKQPGQQGQQRDLVEAIQKIYLGIGRLITSDEAREIINREFNAGLKVPGPVDLGPSVPTPPEGEAATASTPPRRNGFEEEDRDED